MAGGEHVFAILVVFERTRLPQQRIDHMAIVDRRSADARQPRHPLHQVAVVRDIDPFGMDRDIDFLTHQPTRNGVAIATNLDRAAAANTNAAKCFVASDLVIRQRSQLLLFDRESIGPCKISFGYHLFDKRHVVVAAFEVTAATEQQSLIDRVLDVAIQGFDVAVLVGTPSVGVLRADAVVPHQRLIPRGQFLFGGVILNRGAERVGAMQLRHAPELPERFLDAFAEGFERFRKTERDGLDIGVRQDAMKKRVIESRTGDLDPEFIHHGEVTGGDLPGMMLLRKGDGLVGPVGASPEPHAALERPSRGIEMLSRITLLQPRKKRHGLQFGFRFEPLLNLGPDLGEGVHPSAIVAISFALRRHPSVIAIAASRFFIHASHPCRCSERSALIKQPSQFPHLAVRNHRKLLVAEGDTMMR
jgi:hypothetical protein